MTKQYRNTIIRAAAGISLAALCNMAAANAEPIEAQEVDSETHTRKTETASQDEPGCDSSYPTLAAGYFAMLQSIYGTETTKAGGAGRAVAERLPPCLWLPRSRPITPTQWKPGFTRRTRTRYSMPLGNEMGLQRWYLHQGYSGQGFGRIPRRWVPGWSVETVETESYGFPVPR